MCTCEPTEDRGDAPTRPEETLESPLSMGRDYVAPKSITGVMRYPVRRGGTPPPAMSVLVADDDAVSARILEATLRHWGHEVVVARDGQAARQVLQREDCPKLAILDWMMPGLEGPEVCRRSRALVKAVPTYLILLTAKGHSGDIVAGLDSGADDYVTKPFDREELRSRIRVGERVVGLQQAMADRVKELEYALAQVKQLKGLLPICAYCKKVRDDQNYWQRVETYITAHSDARFSHGICPDCWREVIEPDLAAQGATV
ncbi:MAG TPA: response regulator [Urbifossiella sp.]|nr:response regulator [Urbifossiella sp.]